MLKDSPLRFRVRYLARCLRAMEVGTVHAVSIGPVANSFNCHCVPTKQVLLAPIPTTPLQRLGCRTFQLKSQ